MGLAVDDNLLLQIDSTAGQQFLEQCRGFKAQVAGLVHTVMPVEVDCAGDVSTAFGRDLAAGVFLRGAGVKQCYARIVQVCQHVVAGREHAVINSVQWQRPSGRPGNRFGGDGVALVAPGVNAAVQHVGVEIAQVMQCPQQPCCAAAALVVVGDHHRRPVQAKQAGQLSQARIFRQ